MKPLHAGLAAQQAVQSIELTQQGFLALQRRLILQAAIWLHTEGKKSARQLVRHCWKTGGFVENSNARFVVQTFSPFCSAALHGADAARQLAKLQLPVETKFFFLLN